MRKKDDTLRDTLISLARSIADTDGIDAINIRTIAQKAGIATGTMYNYFSNKDEILLALTEEYWMQTLLEMQTAITADSFCGQLKEIFVFLRDRIDRSAGKLMHSLGGMETLGQMRLHAVRAGSVFASKHGTGYRDTRGYLERAVYQRAIRAFCHGKPDNAAENKSSPIRP